MELEKFMLINSADSVTELKNAITKIGNIVISTGKTWTPEFMNDQIDSIVKNNVPFNMATRKYGIRQQLMYLIHYNKTS